VLRAIFVTAGGRMRGIGIGIMMVRKIIGVWKMLMMLM
jgi:hypothetical protein